MSLTAADLKNIRTLVREEVVVAFDTYGRQIIRDEVNSAISIKIEPRFDNIDGRIEALDNDVRDIYEMISKLQKLNRRVAHVEKYNLEKKILTAYKDILTIADDAGIKLPQS